VDIAESVGRNLKNWTEKVSGEIEPERKSHDIKGVLKLQT